MKFKHLNKILVILCAVILIILNFYGINSGNSLSSSIAENQPEKSFKYYISGGSGEQAEVNLSLGINSLAGPYIIDLNTSTDKPHHNITIYGADKYDIAGISIASGDINGDLINDMIISAPYSPGLNNNFAYSGEVYVIFGNSTPSPIIYLNSQPDIVFYGDDQFDYLGTAVTTGDINGDGIEDLLVSAPAASGENNLRHSCGEVYIFYGNPSFPSIWDLSAKPANITIYGKDAFDSIGDALTSGDVNCDNIDDIIFGSSYSGGPDNTRTRSGGAYVIYGNASLPSVIDLAVFNTSNYTTIYGRDAWDQFGSAIGIGDVNSDDFDDLIVGAPNSGGLYNQKTASGEVHIIFGNQSLNSTIDLSESMANLSIFGENSLDYIGYELTSGNLNGDDFDDIIIGSTNGNGPNNGKPGCGEVYIIYGNTSFQQNIFVNESDIIIYGQYDQDAMGNAIDVGDINGDNFDDLIIGALKADGSRDGNDFGEAYIINGSNSLPSIIDLATDNPDILIYGAEGTVGSGSFGDWAGTAVLLSDLNGDNKDEIILSAKFADGRSNNKYNSGEIYIILSGGNLLPIPIIESVDLENGHDLDKKTCYAMNDPYLFRVKITVPNNFENLNTVILNLAYDIPDQNLKFEWSKSTKEFVEVLDQYNLANLNPKSEYNNSFGRVWNFDFYLDFNWTYPDDKLHAVQVIATGYTGFQDLTSLNNFYRVKTYLNFYGNLTVTGEYQGKLSENAWVSKGEQLTWSGLKVIYNGSNKSSNKILYPPKDAGVTVTVSNSSSGAWTGDAGGGETISIKTYANNNTKFGEIYSISITGVPYYCDKSYITFKLNIDADGISFSNPFPNNRTWFPTLKPTCGIRISDPITNVDSSSIQYLTSTNNGITWSNWTEIGILGISQGNGINCTVKPILKEGYNNLIQWHARDIVGNDYNSSEPNQVLVDVSNVTFSNPMPASETVQNDLAVECGITINDQLSGVNASSIEFSTSTSGIWNYRQWQSAQKANNGPIIQCSVTPTFAEGTENYIRWRAKDVVGNGYNISDNYQIKIKLNHPPIVKLKSPENSSILSTITPELVWDGSDPDNDTLRYDIYVSPVKNHIITLNKSARIKDNISFENIKLDTPLTNKVTYYWTVIPIDRLTTGICSSGIWQFKVDTTAEIPMVTLLEPVNNSIITTTTPKLTWELNYSKPEIVTFKIFLTNSNDPEILITEDNAIQKDYKLTSFIIETPLTPGETYYWSAIPVANLVDGKIEGSCISRAWDFKVVLPPKKIYKINMSLESTLLTVVQGNYTSTNITITNLGNFMDMVEISKNQGILDANIAIEHSDAQIKLNASEEITINIGILVSEDAKQSNYTIYFTARSTRAINEGKEESITKSIVLQVLEKTKKDGDEKDDGKGGKGDTGESSLMLWVAICIIIILIIALFLFVYRVNKARKIPYVKSELLYKPPKHLTLQEATVQSYKESELPTGVGAVPILDTSSTNSTPYLLPRAILTNAQKLELLEERFLLGEVDLETYKELKTKLEGSEDISELDSKEFEEDELMDEELLEEEPVTFDEPDLEPVDEDEDLEIDEAAEVERIFEESTMAEAEPEDFKPPEVDLEDKGDDGLIWRPEGSKPEDSGPEIHGPTETVIEKKKPKKKIEKKSKKKKK